jgi:hypothetical protein
MYLTLHLRKDYDSHWTSWEAWEGDRLVMTGRVSVSPQGLHFSHQLSWRTTSDLGYLRIAAKLLCAMQEDSLRYRYASRHRFIMGSPLALRRVYRKKALTRVKA